MAMTPYSGETEIIGKLGTTPQERGLTTQQFKDKFDEGLKAFITWFNATHKAEFDAHLAENASLAQKGHVQLSNDINNASSTLGATANAVKLLGDYFKSFGLGVEAVEKMNTDLNDVSKTGFYKGVNMTNSPNPSNYYYVLCIEWNELGCVQLAFRNSGTFYHEIFIRQKASGTWQPWIALTTEYDIRKGTGSPEGVVTASVGALYRRTDTGNGELYVKKTGTGNTGWGKVTVA